MAYEHPASVEYRRQRFTRPDGDRYLRHDAQRYLKPEPFDHQAFVAEYRAKKAAEAARSVPTTNVLDDPEVRRLLAEIKLDLLRWQYWRKAYNPNQPRVPAGNPNGGQWTKIGDSFGRDHALDNIGDSPGRTDDRIISDATDSLVIGGRYAARNERRGPGPFLRRIGDKLLALSEDQANRFDTANRQADEAIGRVRHVEPTWRPRDSLFEQDVEGQIRRSKQLVLEAEAHLVELGHQSPSRVIDIYRRQNNAFDLFGKETWPRDEDVVGYTVLDGIPVFGTNADAPPYTTANHNAATRWRDALIDLYPDKLRRENPRWNPGWMPNDAMYHAEASVLLRAAERNGGSLAGRTLRVYVDDAMCNRCDTVLPLLATELGNPTVTFVNTRTGEAALLRDGKLE
jgi:hypothetical protein